MEVRSNLARLRALLEMHPRVSRVLEGDSLLDFAANRGIEAAPSVPLGGLIELMDNNPLVCADRAYVPSPEGTLALIAVGPLAEAGLLLEPPVALFSFEPDEARLASDLATANWTQGATCGHDLLEIGTVMSAVVLAKIRTPEQLDEIDELYDERFARSFFVQRVDPDRLDPARVSGSPFAHYGLSITLGDSDSLLTIRVLADRHGKLGEAQVIHMMNVMCGFEESLGLCDRITDR